MLGNFGKLKSQPLLKKIKVYKKRLGQKALSQPQKPPISRFKVGGLAAFKRVPKD